MESMGTTVIIHQPLLTTATDHFQGGSQKAFWLFHYNCYGHVTCCHCGGSCLMGHWSGQATCRHSQAAAAFRVGDKIVHKCLGQGKWAKP